MKPEVCIITGSTLGGAEYLAEHIEDLLQQQGFKTHLYHGPELEEVIEYQHWLVVTSTHGAGEIPDNLRPVFDLLEEDQMDLSNLHFSVIGLGNTDYDTFCYAANRVERILQQKSAVQICPILKIDMKNTFNPEQEAEQWLPNFTQNL
ncbi:FMN-binding protein MioC [[Pasteurella] aerogenes]|nr:FMN-binding protein MioC [[Pasteurella] aerogenes]